MKKRLLLLSLLMCVCMMMLTPYASAKRKVINKNGCHIVNGVLEKYTGKIKYGKKIVLPKEVKAIGKEAFSVYNYVDDESQITDTMKNCHMKLKVDSNIKINKRAFNECFSIDVTYGEGLKILNSNYRVTPAIGVYCKVYLPKTLRVIKKNGLRCYMSKFWGDDNSLIERSQEVRIYLNKGLKVIEEGGLAKAIIDKKLPETIEVIGDYTFADAVFVESDIDYPEKVKGIIYPEMPNNLKSIGAYVFNPNLHRSFASEYTINIPAAVENIDVRVFSKSSGKTPCVKYKVDKKNKVYSNDENGWLYSKDKKTLYWANIEKAETVIQDTVENIEFLAFNRLYRNQPSQESDNINIYMPKKLKKMSRYIGEYMYDYTLHFATKKAPKLTTRNTDDIYEYRRDKILWGNSSVVVPKGSKEEYVKKWKITDKKCERVLVKD